MDCDEETIPYDALPIPAEFVERIERWNDRYKDWLPGPHSDQQSYSAEKLRLTAALAAALGEEYLVECSVPRSYYFRGNSRIPASEAGPLVQIWQCG